MDLVKLFTQYDMLVDDVYFKRTELFIDNIYKLFECDKNTICHVLLNYYLTDYHYVNRCYHTTRHTMAVANLSMEISKTYTLSLYDKQVLFIAAMFHDRGHSYGFKNDCINIANAIKYVDSMAYVYKNIFKLSKEMFDDVCKAIYCTVYPFVVEPSNIVQKILRDSDLLMSIMADNEIFAKGLEKEFQNGGLSVTVTVAEMRRFALRQTFYTDAGFNMIFDGHIIHI